jgi:kynurenine formamidase
MSDADAQVLAGYVDRLSRWGRWGADDQLGALNFVGPAQVAAAAALVLDGRVISLSLPYDQRGPQPGGFRNNPQLIATATGTDHLAGAQDPLPGDWGPAKGFGYADDIVVLPSQAGTQWDALSHIFHEGRMWNGYSAAEHTSRGAARNGIQHWTDRMVMRGVLVDIPRAKGVPALEPGYAITAEDLDTALAAHGADVRTGDALLVRTGHLTARRDEWGDYAGGPAPGLSLHTATWLAEHEVAAVATDTWGVEVRPNEIAYFQPLHTVALVHMGLALGEMFDLDALAVDCAADGRYEFMLVAPPLPVTGAAGAPVAALALK